MNSIEDILTKIKKSSTVEEFKELSEKFFNLNPSSANLIRYFLIDRFNIYQDKDKIFNLIIKNKYFKSNPKDFVINIYRLVEAAKVNNIKCNVQMFADFYLKQGNIDNIKLFYEIIDKRFYNSVKFETYLLFE